MANYKETIVQDTVTKYRRAFSVTITNRLNELVKAQFHEEDVVKVGTTNPVTTLTPVGSVEIEMTDPLLQIPVINPETYEPTQTTVPLGQIYLLMSSLYFYVARERDDAEE